MRKILLLPILFLAFALQAQKTETPNRSVDQIYFKTLKLDGFDTRGVTLCPSGDGNLYVAGAYDGAVFILKTTPLAQVLWTRVFDPFPGASDRISDIFVDSDGMIAGAGNSGNVVPGQGFAFRFDPVNGALLWTIRWDEPNIVYGIAEQTPGGNYLVYGNPHGTPTGKDAELLGLRRTDGEPVNFLQRHFNFDHPVSFRSLTADDNFLYAGGTIQFGPDTENTRPMLVKMNVAGVPLWTVSGPVPPDNAAQLQNADVLVDEDVVVSLYYGNASGTALDDSHLFIQKNSVENGDLLWVKEIKFVGDGGFVEADELVRVSDGYVIYGDAWSGIADLRFLFVIKTDFDGNVLWARTLDFLPQNLASERVAQDQLLELDGNLYFTGHANSLGGPAQAALVRLNLNGDLAGFDCPYLLPIPAVTTALTDPAQFVVNLGQYQPIHPYLSITAAVNPIGTEVTTVCTSTPPFNPCDTLTGPTVLLNLGPDVILCDDTLYTFNAGPGFSNYLWSTGATTPSISVIGAATYWVEVTDTCGYKQRDSVSLTYSLLNDIALPDLSVCAGESVVVTELGFDNYQWSPSVGLNCTNCPSVTITPAATTKYYLLATSNVGCVKSDSFTVTVQPLPTKTATITFAPGGSVVIQGITYTQPGTVQVILPGAGPACDTLATFILQQTPPPPAQDYCDIDGVGCFKFELLDIRRDAQGDKIYRFRVVNNCADEMNYVAFRLPNGVNALAPANGATYTAPSGRTYAVRNPNTNPFHSIRFKTGGAAISGGQSDIFVFTLPQQSDPLFFQVYVKLFNGASYEAYLNTFDCPILPFTGLLVQPERPLVPEAPRGSSAAEARGAGSAVDAALYPNPTAGVLYLETTPWPEGTLHARVLGAQGQVLQTAQLQAGAGAQMLRLRDDLPNGLYFLEACPEDSGERQVWRFWLLR